MPRIIVAQFITLDGVIEDPDGSSGTPFGGWAFRHGREAVAGDKFAYGPLLQTGVFVFGRRTWEHFSSLWPGRDDAFARAFNAADKAVATRSGLDVARWQNSAVIPGDLVEWSRQTSTERDVIVIGSTAVVRALQNVDAVDEYRLRVFPTAAGRGRRLFPDGRRLDVVSNEIYGPTTLLIATPAADPDLNS